MPIFRKPLAQQDEEQMKPRGTGAGIAPGATGSAGVQFQGPAPTSAPGGHVNLADYIRANQGQAKQMADKLAGGTAAVAGMPGAGEASLDLSSRMKTSAAVANSNPMANKQMDAARDIERRSGLLGSWGGRDELLNQEYGKAPGGYSQGERGLDNALAGAASGGAFEQAASRYKGLADTIRKQQQAFAQRATGLGVAAQQAQRRRMADKLQDMERVDEGPRNKGVGPKDGEAPPPMKDLTNGANAQRAPDSMTDEELNAMGYMHSPAPNESYSHFSDRVAARGGK